MVFTIKHNRIIKFIISGSSAALVEFTVFMIIINFLNMLIFANIISFMAGLIVSFSLNRKWVFYSKGHIKKQFYLYLLLAFINIGLSSLLLFIFVEWIGVVTLLAKIVTISLMAIWNYFLFSRFIFNK